MPNRFVENKNAPIDKFGPCPECGAKLSKIVWGWHGVYYDVVCSDGHLWTYEFPKPSREALLERAVNALVMQANKVSVQTSYVIAGVLKCDVCKGTAHKDTCALGEMERLMNQVAKMKLLPEPIEAKKEGEGDEVSGVEKGHPGSK